MKLILVKLFFLYFFILSDNSFYNHSAIIEGNVIFEKMYLHVDRGIYAPGDDIWFKSYLINGFNNKLIPGYKNIYVQLISNSGKIIDDRLLISQEGTATGDFNLPVSIKEGTYFIRAYTRYQTNFSDEGYFYKKIFVAEPKNITGKSERKENEGSERIDISFLPEGGNFAEGVTNNIAFKAIDTKGRGILVKGKIIDGSGEEVSTFETRYKGMGRFELTPENGKTYFAKVDEFPDFSYQFETASPDAVSFSSEHGEKGLFFIIRKNATITEPQDFILKATCKDNVLISKRITVDEQEVETMLLNQFFPTGVSKVTLLDLQDNVVAERLVFIQNKKETIQISLDKDEYTTRNKVELEISTLLPRNDEVDSALSISVVNENYLGATGIDQTIESYLLLDSELKGFIESPASCFVEEEDISSEEKLDLVMLVNGWRNYYWNELEKYNVKELAYWEDLGLSFRGKLTNLLGQKPISGGKVVLSPYVGGLQFKQTETDKEGNFSFDGLIYKDSALIIIDAENGAGSKKVDIDFEQPQIFDTNTKRMYTENNFSNEALSEIYREEFERMKSEREYKIKAEDILIDEVKVLGKRSLNDGHIRIYGEPDVSLEITDDDLQYMSVIDYLENRVASVIVIPLENGRGGSIRIRGAKDNPLLIIDGIPVLIPFGGSWEEAIGNIPFSDIDKIEILKSGFSTAAFGSKGDGGVISIFTKIRNRDDDQIRNVPGRITPYIRGFKQSRHFYSPKYTLENIKNERPDFRPTLYWNPNVLLKNGHVKLEFYTSDKLARYRIIVEGISKKGNVCYGTGILTASDTRE